MNWKIGKPSESGYYWCESPLGGIRLMRVSDNGEVFYTHEGGGMLLDNSYFYAEALWYGPLTPPTIL